MADRIIPGPVEGSAQVREAVCVHTRKIFDSCRDKDCIEDLRLYLDCVSQSRIANAVGVRARTAELLYSSVCVEAVSFNRGYYTVDIRNFYKITGEAYSLVSGSECITGLAVFDKRCLLFGSEGTAKVFSSDTCCPYSDTGLPIAVVEAVDPIVLNMKLVEVTDCAVNEMDLGEIPDYIAAAFPSGIARTNDFRRVYVTLGQFSIVRLERDTQILIPIYNYCMPEKECTCGGEDDPCDLFKRIRFPVDEFFPPDTMECSENYKEFKDL